MSPRRRISDQSHPAYTPGAWPVGSALLLFWALVIAAMLQWAA
jgi:hypothetical protein